MNPGRRTFRFLHVLAGFGLGGLELRTASIINSLGSNVRHYILALNGDLGAASRLSGDVRVEYVTPPRERGLRMPYALRRVMRSLRPDLALTYNWGAMDGVIGNCFLPVCPLVHNESGLGVDEANRRKIRRRLTRALVLNRAFKTIVISSTLLRIARCEYHIRPRKLRLIRDGIDTTRFSPGCNPELRDRIGAGGRDPVFGFVGRLSDEKNLPLLLRAFQMARLDQARLLIVGDGPRAAELHRLVHELDLADRVVFAGHVDDPLPYYRAMDVFTMSSATEQMPNSLLEAMACSLPAICTRVGDCAELLGADSQPLLVAPNDAAGYCRALELISHNRHLMRELGDKNRARCVAEFSFDRMIDAYRREYAAALRVPADDLS